MLYLYNNKELKKHVKYGEIVTKDKFIHLIEKGIIIPIIETLDKLNKE